MKNEREIKEHCYGLIADLIKFLMWGPISIFLLMSLFSQLILASFLNMDPNYASNIAFTVGIVMGIIFALITIVMIVNMIITLKQCIANIREQNDGSKAITHHRANKGRLISWSAALLIVLVLIFRGWLTPPLEVRTWDHQQIEVRNDAGRISHIRFNFYVEAFNHGGATFIIFFRLYCDDTDTYLSTERVSVSRHRQTRDVEFPFRQQISWPVRHHRAYEIRVVMSHYR